MEPVGSEPVAIPRPGTSSGYQNWGRRWARGVTIVIVLNLILVFFNLTYVPLRQIYLHYFPPLVETYDPVKGIEPHPVTQNYLAKILNVRSQITRSGLSSDEVQSTLNQLRQQSTTLVEENPFLASGQITTFAHLKRRIQTFTGAQSAELAFRQFWQPEYLQQVGWEEANVFVTKQIEPLLKQNYFREALPTGQFVDEFWRIDLFFILFFGAELLIRTFIISRAQKDISWGAALARRWYELPLILPFWRWLRIIPAGVRLHRTKICNIENLIGQITHEPAAYLSDRVSKFAMVRLINQTQTSVQQGTLLTGWRSDTPYTQVGSPEKVDQITDRLVQLIVLRVMPSVKPDLEQLLRHSLRRALIGSEFYFGLQQVPGLDTLPGGALDGVADYLAQASCDVLVNSYNDHEGRVLLDQLSRDFRHTLGKELQAHTNSDELRGLLSDLLEELKLNYIQRSEQEDPEATLREVDALDQQTQSSQTQ